MRGHGFDVAGIAVSLRVHQDIVRRVLTDRLPAEDPEPEIEHDGRRRRLRGSSPKNEGERL